MRRSFTLLLALAWAHAPAMAQPDPALAWCEVGAVGNRPTNPGEVPWLPDLQFGAVDYEYSITQTEVTVRQWYDFVVAYAPYYDGPPNSIYLTGSWINYSPVSGYSYSPGRADWPIATSWRIAARYVNWLENGRAAHQAAFESGVYDTSTFSTSPEGYRTDQLTHAPNTRYRIPTENEWVKATYFDPHRHGPGQEGYWLFTNKSDTPPTPGPPGLGNTNAGTGDFSLFAAGSYPDAMSPWGLLDTSGGETEWLQTASDSIHRFRQKRSSSIFNGPFYTMLDRIDSVDLNWAAPESLSGFRVVYEVPAPSSGVVFISVVAHFRRRKRWQTICGPPCSPWQPSYSPLRLCRRHPRYELEPARSSTVPR